MLQFIVVPMHCSQVSSENDDGTRGKVGVGIV